MPDAPMPADRLRRPGYRVWRDLPDALGFDEGPWWSGLIAAVFVIEAVGFGAAQLFALTLPGLLACGIGALLSTGLGDWTGIEIATLGLPALPDFARPDIAAGHAPDEALFSGQQTIVELVGDLVALIACLGGGYAISLAAFRRGPVFPAALLAPSGIAVMPLVVVATVTAFVVTELLDPARRASSTV